MSVMQEEKEKEKVKTSLRLESRTFWGIKHLAVIQRRNITALAEEAFTDLLKKYEMEQGASLNQK